MAGPDLLSTHRRQRRHRQQRQRASTPRRGGIGTMLVVAPVMVVGFLGTLAALQWSSARPEVTPAAVMSWAPGGDEAVKPDDRLSARFGSCHSGGGTHCVVDGDTFWYAGEKYRIADIDTPETHPARCAEEARLGEAATRRLRAWLNAGAFSLESVDRDTDRYGRKLRIVTRGGASVADTLIGEGLARPWEGSRRPWC